MRLVAWRPASLTMKKCHPIRTLGHRLRSLFPTADRRVARAGIVEALEPRIAPATFMVTTVADSGDGSLRKAILDANAMPNLGGPDQIQFFIPGTGVKTIAPTTALPPISDAVVVDGYTQPGAARNTNGPGLGDNAVLRIELNGAGAGASVAGLTFGTNSGGSRVSGLAINRFGGDGILLQSGGNTIEGNFIGIDLTGTQALGNDVGVRIDNAINNTIGGTVAGARNVISDNSEGVEITGSAAAGNIVQGNFIGTDASGTVGIPNFIGVAVTSNAHDNTIGGTTSGAGNVIAFNNGPGVNVVLGTGNAIRGNSIHSNGDPRVGLGINLGRDGMTPNDTGDPDSGANNLQNFPVITNVMLATGDVTGTINSTPSTALTLDFYSNPEDRNQGRVFLGSLPVTTDASGNRSYIFRSQTAIAPGSYVSATATDAGGNTSEFSAQFPGPVIVWDAGGGADTSWFNAANWAPNGVPTASDSILLNTNAMITLSGTNVTVANFTQTDGTFTGSATLTVTGTFAFGKGTLGGTGMTVVGAGGTFAFNDLGATDAKTLDARTLSILGTGTVAGSDDLTMNNGARLLIGGSFATGTQFDFLHAAGANALVRINPGASLTVNDSTDIAPGVVFDGQGPITFPNPSGALNIQGGGSFIGGTITLKIGRASCRERVCYAV